MASVIRAPNHINFSKADLLNALSVEDAKSLYEAELKQYANVQDPSTGCISSTRSISAGYPVVQIPKRLWPPAFREITEEKGQYKVMVHQLAYRATGKKVPNYAAGIDIIHTCGNGKMNTKHEFSTTKPCINSAHLNTAGHRANMMAQRCQPIIRCKHCKLLTRQCNHEPNCHGGDGIENEFAQQEQRQIVKIIVVYDDDSEEVVECD